MRRSLTFAVLAALWVVTSGCQPRIYRGETVLRSDGGVSRAIYQPVETTPEAARRADLWMGSTYAKRIGHNAWEGNIDALPRARRDAEHDYFAGWGEFQSPTALPQAFAKEAPEGLPDGKLVVDYQREDLGLVVEHRWRETLTDIVTIDDMHAAREELAQVMIPLCQKILGRVLGDAYDTQRFVAWLEQEGRPWFFDMTDVVFAVGAQGGLSEERIAQAVAPVCARHGLVITDAAGKIVDGDRFQSILGRFAKQVLRDQLRRKDGKPVEAQTIDELVQWLGLEDRPENSEARFQRYEAAVEAAIAEQFGGDAGFETATAPLIARLLGLYAGELLGSAHQFQYALEMPGPIVKTNGTLIADREVRWKFAGIDAYPAGYTMECEALVPQSELETKLLGRRALRTREALVDYVQLVRGDEGLRQAMADCSAAKSLAPFQAARQNQKPDTNSAAAFEAMRRLLGVGK